MCICIILYYMQVLDGTKNILCKYICHLCFYCKLVLLQTCVIDNARFKLNDHNKIPLSLHAGLIGVYLS